MVKVTSSLIVGAALFASSSTLAAPTRFKRATAEITASTDALDANDEKDLVDEATAALGLDQQTGSAESLIADNLRKRDAKRTGSEAIRRGLPLTPESAADLAKRDSVVAKLGLTGALAPLGVGPLLPTVQGLVDGLPVVGAPVGGLVRTVDTTVGLTDLLNKPKAKRDLLDSLTGTLGGATGAATAATGGTGGLLGGLGGLGSLTSALPLGGTLDAGSSTVNGLLGQLQGAGASSSQLAGVLGQLQGLGLGNLPLSALTGGSATGSATSAASTVQNQASSVASNPSAASVQQATSILQGLTVAQAEQYGLLPSGTSGRLLAQIEAATAAQTSGNNLASSFRTYGFKAHHESNETMHETEGGATPTFSIASPDAVASAIYGSGGMVNSTMISDAVPSATSAAAMAKRSAAPVPAATAKPSDAAEDSGSDYSDESDYEDSDVDSESDRPATPTSTSSLARRGGPMEDESEGDMKKHHGGMEGQGPNASEGWHATESSSMAHTQSQAVATAEAMTFTYSDASATAVPTTAPSKRSYADLD
ncbi:uncharacterized protein JCM15063_000987 [Sporobolomyces koalae]|uniref:uncharacterized protein n=1 Tax=Sporobolomyces koalae TaxID=500713 RepID=UPI003179A669